MELNKKFQDSLDLGRNAGAARFRKIENVQQILWIQNNQIPPFYIEVLQYVTCTLAGQAIDTNLLFPLLVYSRLPQDVLGQIWSVCNQTFPGQLTLQEFFAALALVAICQQNNSAQISLQTIADFPKDLSQRPEPLQQAPVQQQVPSQQSQAPICENLEDDDEFGDFAESTGELPVLQASYAPTIKSSDIVTPIDSFHKEPIPEIHGQNTENGVENNQQKVETQVYTTPIPVITVPQPEFSFPVSAPVPSGFAERKSEPVKLDPEPVSMEKGDIYAALRDIQGPSASEELPELELPVFQRAPSVNIDAEKEEDDDFGDFEEAKEDAIPEIQSIENLQFKKPEIPKVLSLDIQKFEQIAKETPSPSEPVYDPFALSFNAANAPISQMAKTMSSDFDLLAGLDFGTPSEPVQPIEAPTTEDRLAQVLSLDLPDLQETQNRSVNDELEGAIIEETEEISSPEIENMPSWDIITNETDNESKSRSESEIAPVSVDHSEVQENEQVEEKPAPEAPIQEQQSTKKPKRRSLLSKAEPVWKKLLKECFRVIRITHDVFKGAEAEIITEILLAKEGQDYLANVCSIYLASYRFLSALRHFGFAITSEMKEIDSMWESLADLVQNHSKTLELPFAKVRPITRDCKICLHKCKEDYHSICKCMYVEIIKEDLPDFRLTS